MGTGLHGPRAGKPRRFGGRAGSQRAAELFEVARDADALCQAWILRGDLQIRSGDIDQALDSFGQALRLLDDPDSGMTASIAEYTRPHVQIYIGKALGRSGRMAEGRAAVQRALDAFDDRRTLEQAVALQ